MTDDDVLQQLRAAWSGRGMVRWLDDADQVEQRPNSIRDGRHAMGRSTVIVTCPFCHADIEAYAWSLAGSGKRCTCGALHGRDMSQGWKIDPAEPPTPEPVKRGYAVMRADDDTVHGRVLEVLFGGSMLTVKWFGGDVETVRADQVRSAPHA